MSDINMEINHPDYVSFPKRLISMYRLLTETVKSGNLSAASDYADQINSMLVGDIMLSGDFMRRLEDKVSDPNMPEWERRNVVLDLERAKIRFFGSYDQLKTVQRFQQDYDLTNNP